MYKSTLPNLSDYVPVWAINLAIELGKTEREARNDWYMAIALIPDYSSIHKNCCPNEKA